MGWLFREDITRQELIAERTESWKRNCGDLLVESTCLAHCFRGGSFSGVLWTVWERTFTVDDIESKAAERWIGCDLLQYRRDSGWGCKDLDESMHPYYYSCPMKYLNMVPLDEFGGNAEWRAMVIEHHDSKRASRRSRAVMG